MWGVGRRSGLFIISYAPLAAMFVVLEWPTGWSATALGHLGIWLAAAGTLAVLPAAGATLTGKGVRKAIGIGFLASIAVVAIGSLHGWTEPMAILQPKPQTSAAASGVAFAFCVMAAVMVAVILYSARLVGRLHFSVVDVQDQGSAVAGYLATYLLPLLALGQGGWRLIAAYAIYLITVYVVFVRSENLVLVNPTLYLIGFRVFGAELDAADRRNRRRVILLTKDRLGKEAELAVRVLGEDSYVAKVEDAEWAGKTRS
jgi:hypothetical protein